MAATTQDTAYLCVLFGACSVLTQYTHALTYTHTHTLNTQNLVFYQKRNHEKIETAPVTDDRDDDDKPFTTRKHFYQKHTFAKPDAYYAHHGPRRTVRFVL